MFTWIPIYKEIADKLLEFRTNRDELVDLLMKMENDNLKVISLNDRLNEDSKETIKIRDIDPFSFFANFNRSTTDKNRQAFLERLKQKWGLQKSIPSDFSGLPALTPQNAWFFAYTYHREPDAIDNLWVLYQQVMERNPRDVDADLFNKCLTQRGVKQNITAGLFWVQPNDYFPLVGGVEKYLTDEFGINEIRIDKLKYSGYLELLAEIRKKTDKPFYEISHESYMSSHDFTDERKSDELIEKFLKSDLYKHFKEYHLSQKIEREKKAWDLIESNKGNIRRKIIEEFIEIVDSHINPEGEKKSGWFGLMLMGNNRKKILSVSDEALNEWITTLLFSDLEYEVELEKCMNELKIPGASYGFASLLLYLSNPERFNVFISSLAISAFKLIFDKDLKAYKKGIERYNAFNKYAIELRDQYNLMPQEMDWFFNNINHFYENNEGISDMSDKKKDRNKTKSQERNIGLNTILYGPPGTGKTYKTIERAVQIIENLSLDELNSNYDSRTDIKKKYQEYFYKGQIQFVTFHQSFSYEDFIEGIKPILQDEKDESDSNNELKYTIEKGVFQKIAEDANESKKRGEDKKFVLIIDEINRGNIANIFGELITLIEDDKRKGATEELTAELPYSKEEFSIPDNLYLIGTMNTADRSVEALDTALRRRFNFEEIAPDPDLINPSSLVLRLWEKYDNLEWKDDPFNSRVKRLYDFLGFDDSSFKASKNIYSDIGYKNWNELDLSTIVPMNEFNGFRPDLMLQKINNRIEVLLDSDHCIGHAYFMSLSDCDDPFAELKKIFRNKIIPLLQEYFYGDLAKIGLVLGKDFIEYKSVNNAERLFADFDYENIEEYEEVPIIKRIDVEKLGIDSFKKIYE